MAEDIGFKSNGDDEVCMEAVVDGKEGAFPVAYIVNLYVNTGERRFDGTDRWPALARVCIAKLCTLDNPKLLALLYSRSEKCR